MPNVLIVTVTGPILSGEKLITDQTFRDQLLTRVPDAIGGEMEGTGLCTAAIELNVTKQEYF